VSVFKESSPPGDFPPVERIEKSVLDAGLKEGNRTQTSVVVVAIEYRKPTLEIFVALLSAFQPGVTHGSGKTAEATR
jgi:hypothetical protein